MHQLLGHCHCGNIRLRYDSPLSAPEIPGRACGCSFCTRHGAIYASDTSAALRCEIGDPGQVVRYRFGTETAEFLTCQVCGVLTAALSEIDGVLYAVVNLRVFPDIDLNTLLTVGSDFDGESPDDRITRRCRNWIADVTIIERNV